MTQKERISGFETRANAINWTLNKLCGEAGVAYSTFIRWKSGTTAQEGSLDKIESTLDAEEGRLREYLAVA